MRLSAFDTFCLFMALRNHFTTDSYDFIKYKGKSRFTQESFLSNKDKLLYQKLSRACDENDMRDYLIATFIADKRWVRDFLEEEAKDRFTEYRKRNQSLGYMFGNELDRLFLLQAPELAFKATGNYALPIRMYIQGDMSLETFALLNRYLGLVQSYDAKYGKDDIVWGRMSMLIRKFTPFLIYDEKKMKSILKDKINENISRKEQGPSQTAYIGSQEVQKGHEGCR
jgi:hypothetical protein